MTIIFSINFSDTKANSRQLKTFSGVRGTLIVKYYSSAAKVHSGTSKWHPLDRSFGMSIWKTLVASESEATRKFMGRFMFPKLFHGFIFSKNWAETNIPLNKLFRCNWLFSKLYMR